MVPLEISGREPLYFLNGDGGRAWGLMHYTEVELHFIGASVTVQRDGWVDRFAELARQRTGRAHAATKNAMGGVGLLFGLANYKPPAAALPRVAFVEFSTGDLNLGLTPLDCLRPWLVRLLDRLQRDEATVVFVHNWRADFDPDDRAGVRRTYDEVAQEFGVPVIQNHLLADSLIKQDPSIQPRYFRDVCHTMPAGAAEYAQHVLSCLEKMSHQAATRGAMRQTGRPISSDVRFYDFPPAAVDPNHCAASMYVYPGTEQAFRVYDFQAGQILSFVATGQMLGASFISGPRTGWVSLRISGEFVRSFRCFDRNSHYDRYILLPAPFKLDQALVELECAATEIDVSLPLKPHPDYHLPRLMRAIGLAGIDLALKAR